MQENLGKNRGFLPALDLGASVSPLRHKI